MGVPHRCDDALVAQEFLNGPDVNPRHDEPTSECVPVAVPTEIINSCTFQYNWEPLVWRIYGKNVWRTARCLEVQKGPTQDTVHWNVAALPVLAPGDSNNAASEVDVFPFQAAV